MPRPPLSVPSHDDASPSDAGRRRALGALAAAGVVAAGCGGGTDVAGVGSGGTGAPTPVFASGPITGFGSVIVDGIRFDGEMDATPAPGVVAAIQGADVVLIAPSNPYVSIGPILAVAAIRESLAARRGSIIVMHTDKLNTVRALPKVIDGLRAKGFKLVTVGQLIGLPGPVPVFVDREQREFQAGR